MRVKTSGVTKESSWKFQSLIIEPPDRPRENSIAVGMRTRLEVLLYPSQVATLKFAFRSTVLGKMRR